MKQTIELPYFSEFANIYRDQLMALYNAGEHPAEVARGDYQFEPEHNVEVGAPGIVRVGETIHEGEVFRIDPKGWLYIAVREPHQGLFGRLLPDNPEPGASTRIVIGLYDDQRGHREISMGHVGVNLGPRDAPARRRLQLQKACAAIAMFANGWDVKSVVDVLNCDSVAEAQQYIEWGADLCAEGVFGEMKTARDENGRPITRA